MLSRSSLIILAVGLALIGIATFYIFSPTMGDGKWRHFEPSLLTESCSKFVDKKVALGKITGKFTQYTTYPKGYIYDDGQISFEVPTSPRTMYIKSENYGTGKVKPGNMVTVGGTNKVVCYERGGETVYLLVFQEEE
jgi:hypothetical protein